MSLEALLRVAGRQYGCVSWKQALDVSTRRCFQRLVEKAVFERVWPEVYVLAGAPDCWGVRAQALLLSVPGSVLSHGSAAAVFAWPFVENHPPTVTGPPNGIKSRPGVKLHRSEQLAGFTTLHKGWPVTTPARTIIDLSSDLSVGQLGALVDKACMNGTLQLQAIRQTLDEMSTQGLPKISRIREVLATRIVDDKNVESHFELRTLRLLRGSGLPKPVLQHVVHVFGRTYRLDMAYPEIKVAIEVDGPHHLMASQAEKDRHRDAQLALAGWLVIHISNLTDTNRFVNDVRRALAARAALRSIVS